MEDLRIVGWTDFECEYPSRQLAGEELNRVVELVRKEVAENDYIFSGEEHQNGDSGVPVFSDGTCFRASMRCWAQLMASIYVRSDGTRYSYMTFYKSLGDDTVMPPESGEIDIEPAVLEEESMGCYVKEDHDLLIQTYMSGSTLLTYDKVLIKAFNKLTEEKLKRRLN